MTAKPYHKNDRNYKESKYSFENTHTKKQTNNNCKTAKFSYTNPIFHARYKSTHGRTGFGDQKKKWLYPILNQSDSQDTV